MERIALGDRFGKLTVIGATRRSAWICRCECGREKIIPPSRLVVSKSCGCAPGQRPNTIETIMERLEVTETGCWVWMGARAGGTETAGRYGVVTYQGNRCYVHRLLYEHFVGPIPEGMVLDHVRCDNPPCANPAHVAPATQTRNILRGRSPVAENGRKTHCKRGHELSPENVHLELWHGKSLIRRCLICRREKDRQDWRQRAAAEGRAVRPPSAERTECPQGHPYSGDNLQSKPGGLRRCRACNIAACRKQYARRKAARENPDA